MRVNDLGVTAIKVAEIGVGKPKNPFLLYARREGQRMPIPPNAPPLPSSSLSIQKKNA